MPCCGTVTSNDAASALRASYGLTLAEAAVVRQLIEKPHSLQAIADVLGVTLNTVKTHISRVFGKTRTHRQGELIKLALTLPKTTT